MTDKHYITKIPYNSKHIRDTLKVKTTHLCCGLYIKSDANRHCRDMKCDGHKLYFCYTLKERI